MPSFRSLRRIFTPARTYRFLKFLEQFLTPTPSREKAASIANLFLNPGVQRKGAFGIANEFLNPRVRRDGFWATFSQFIRPEPPRSGFMKVVTAFLDAPVYRLQQGGNVTRPRQRNATFLQRLISGINEFLNAYTHFSDLFGKKFNILEVPSDAFKAALEKIILESRARIQRLTQRLFAGQLTPQQFQALMISEIKRVNVAAALLGIRGLGNVTPQAITAIVAQTSAEVARLQRFMANSFGPNLTRPLNISGMSEKQFRAYANRFASAGRAASTVAQAALMQSLYGAAIGAGGLMYHRRVVVGDDRSCASCVAYASIGWVRMDSGVVLPPPGTACECEQNCRCLLEFCLTFSNDCPDDYG